ncbi:hypothetical protein H6G95_33155 [Nostoc linckia FACHB-391]|uniref:Uncharacterized protein n=3 Tax=Nostocaceae TaxID=1162 RepID=A0A8J7AH94_DESMC|nr:MULTISPECIES: hypothetical protein [Nostocaceae]MBD2565338.1 hypothetical protein [Nostoc linckia FACHB-391]MBD2651010.1 hypothetical protein [Nostoc foliaceum FACHB-393]MCF2151834.1 hypothetical protein [Desmonostoc muscorum LEGE 12446]
MEPKQSVYSFDQQLKLCQLQTEVDYLLQQMLEIKQNLCLLDQNPALQSNHGREQIKSKICKNNSFS